MKTNDYISPDVAKKIGEKLNINFDSFHLLEFTDAMNLELNAELKTDPNMVPETISEDELEDIGRLTLAHIHPYTD